jgi:D-beta-D-heptose 7-phosphate kinase/D-beta-D-heptose 1-phosphate adenosyltransferase
VNRSDLIPSKIVDAQEAVRMIRRWRLPGKKIAFTNGVFDILHPGHLYSLSAAAREADYLVVGLNSDTSVKRLKGPERPVNDEQSRALVLDSLVIVDAVVIFEEDTTLGLVKLLMPDVMVKGGDYKVHEIAGAREVQEAGGRVVINPILPEWSTTSLIQKIRKA